MTTYSELVKIFREKNAKPKGGWRYTSWADSFEQGDRPFTGKVGGLVEPGVVHYGKKNPIENITKGNPFVKSKEAVQASAEGNIKLRTSENIDFPVLRKPPGSEKAAPYTEILWPDKTIDGKSYKEAFIDEIKLRNKFPQKSTQARAAGVLTNEQLMKKYGIRSICLLYTSDAADE